MVVGIVLYRFELNSNEDSEIEPEFKTLIEEYSGEVKIYLNKIITMNEIFSLFYQHTTGISEDTINIGKKNVIVARLKETAYQVISYYFRTIDEKQYLIISIFKLDEDIEAYETNIQLMESKIEEIFEKMMRGNLKNQQFMLALNEEMHQTMKFAIFNIDRLSNLTKLQKLALIFSTPERIRTLEILRKGPVSRRTLQYELLKIKDNANLDLILAPFLELNIIRRDWAKGIRDTKLGIIRGEGEFIFLVKDVALIRSPPNDIVKEMKNNKLIGQKYLEEIKTFYENYNPFDKINEESRKLALYLLDPDIFDFLALMRTKPYPREKIPKVVSSFSNLESVLNSLFTSDILRIVVDNTGREWVCMLSDIEPLVVYPQYLLNEITERSHLTPSVENLDTIYEPVTMEVAIKGLELLEVTYNEKIEF